MVYIFPFIQFNIMSIDFNLNLFAEISKKIYDTAKLENRLIENPSVKELKKLTENELGVKKSKFGNYVAESEPTSRSAMFTENSIDYEFGDDELNLLKHCKKSLNNQKIVSIDRIVGNLESNITVRLILPLDFVHVAYGGGLLFANVNKVLEIPTYEIIMFFDDNYESNKKLPLPEKDITIRLAMLENGRMIKICRNTNYIGEYKKGVFAAQDWRAKFDKVGIFLHAGCREDYLQSVHGIYRYVRSLFIALSANGKTTTTCKVLGRKRQREILAYSRRWGHINEGWLIQRF